MKRIVLLFLLMITSLFGFAQGCLDAVLSQEMTRHNDDERMEVVVLMKSQYDRAQLSRMASYFPTQKERRTFEILFRGFATRLEKHPCRDGATGYGCIRAKHLVGQCAVF